MDVLVFSDNPDISRCFLAVAKVAGYTTSYRPYKEFRKGAKALRKNTFIYIDVEGLKEEEREGFLKHLSKCSNLSYGIIDITGKIKDIGGLFHRGASDYIGKETYHEGITAKRLRKAYELHRLESPEDKSSVEVLDLSECVISSEDWRTVRPGKEYIFCFMYILLENHAGLTKNFSDEQIAAADSSFRAYIDRTVTKSGGKIWIWNGFEGLVLFPFDGKRCNAVLTCFRLMLSQKIYSVETPYFHNMLSLRIVLHIGNTIYRKAGDTGTIVSDSINTVFNLGRKFGYPGNFYLTKQVLGFAQRELRGCFIPVGHYNGVEIMRMRLPV